MNEKSDFLHDKLIFILNSAETIPCDYFSSNFFVHQIFVILTVIEKHCK